jgi:hypothetical protein
MTILLDSLERIVSIFRDVAIIFVCYKALQALNVYIKK